VDLSRTWLEATQEFELAGGQRRNLRFIDDPELAGAHPGSANYWTGAGELRRGYKARGTATRTSENSDEIRPKGLP
jgi:hypothetical protein